VPDELFTGVEVVYHLAGRAHALAASPADAKLFVDVNARGTEEVARRAKRAGVRRFVFMSTVKALGEPGNSVVREDQPSTATDPYGRSKYSAEQALMALSSADFTVAILRPALVYGPGAKGNLEALLKLLRGGRMPPIPRINNRRSLVGVNDLVDAAVIAGTHPAVGGRAYAVTDGVVYSTSRIVEILAMACGVTRAPRVVIPEAVLRAGAAFGDLAHRLTRRRLPLDSDVLRRLFGNAEYEAIRLRRDAGFTPRQTLADLAESMVAATRDSW
jgi:nucleoside-diphosphate-sugar epimerase